MRPSSEHLDQNVGNDASATIKPSEFNSDFLLVSISPKRFANQILTLHFTVTWVSNVHIRKKLSMVY